MHSEKYLKNRGSKSVSLYVPLMKDLPIIPPHSRIFKSLFTHLKQHIVTSFQIENGLYCLNKVNANRHFAWVSTIYLFLLKVHLQVARCFHFCLLESLIVLPKIIKVKYLERYVNLKMILQLK